MGRVHRARWAKAVTRLLDDELDPVALDRVLRHLERCPGCLRELELTARLQWSIGRIVPAG